MEKTQKLSTADPWDYFITESRFPAMKSRLVLITSFKSC